MNNYPFKIKKSFENGFSVIEILIAMVIGLVLTLGTTQIYLGNKQTSRMTDDLSRMQESARFAMHMLTKDIRMAGFMPCRLTGNMVNTVNGGSSSDWLNFFGGPLLGLEGGVSTFPTEMPGEGTNPGDRVAGTDGVMILRGGNETYKVVSHNANSAQFKLNNLHTLADGDIVMVCDAKNAAILQVTNSNPNNVTVVHNTGTGSPGNCTKSLGGSGDCSDPSNISPYTFGDDSQLVVFRSTGYYIGVSSDGETNSLYRTALVNNAGTLETQNQELLEGIENMQILYGLDLSGDGLAQRYVSADNIVDWTQVVNVRVGLLAHTGNEVAPIDDTNDYNVAGTIIGTSGANSHPVDKRMRYVFSSTVKIRNRGIN